METQPTEPTAPPEQPKVEEAKAPEAKPADAKPAETPAEPKKYKLAINGKDKELTEAEVIAYAQKAGAADENMREAAETRENVIRIFEQLKGNPVDVLSKLGVDFRKLATDYLYEIYNRENMKPEEREAYETKQKLAEYEKAQAEKDKQLEEYKTKAEQAEADRLTAQYQESLQDIIIGGLDKSGSTLPKNEKTVALVAEHLTDLIKSDTIKASDIWEGKVDLAPVLKYVEENYNTGTRGYISGMPVEKVVEILGEDVVKKIVEESLKKYNPDMANRVKEKSEGKTREEKRQSFSEARSGFREIAEALDAKKK